MSQSTPPSANSPQDDRLLWKGFSRFIDQVAPSLFEVGVWLFGGLLAFDLLVLAALFTVGPEQAPIRLATASLAFALPLNLFGLILLRLLRELKDASYERKLVQALQDEGFASEQLPSPEVVDASMAAVRKRRTAVVLPVAAATLLISLLLSLLGLVATLWYMSWWIAVGFLIVVLLASAGVIATLAAGQVRQI